MEKKIKERGVLNDEEMKEEENERMRKRDF